MPWPRQRCKNASSAAVLAQNYTVSRSSIPKQASLLSFAMPCYNMVSSELTEARVQLRPSDVATKPHHVEATPPEVQLRPSVVAAKPGHVAATPLAVDERQLVLYRQMRSTLNLSTNEKTHGATSSATAPCRRSVRSVSDCGTACNRTSSATGSHTSCLAAASWDGSGVLPHSANTMLGVASSRAIQFGIRLYFAT